LRQRPCGRGQLRLRRRLRALPERQPCGGDPPGAEHARRRGGGQRAVMGPSFPCCGPRKSDPRQTKWPRLAPDARSARPDRWPFAWTADRLLEEIPTMWFRSLFGSGSDDPETAARRRPAQPRRRTRLSVEALEDRALLSTFVVDRLTDTGAGT